MRKALRNGWKRVCSVVLAAAMVVTMLPANTQAATASSDNGDGTFSNPAIYADVPDADVIRVGSAYYMVSTTMQFSPGCPIMKSADLVNWEIVNYVYDVLGDTDAMSLRNGENMYGMGQEAASLKFHNGTYYAAFNAGIAGEAYIFTTKDIENGTWEKHVIKGDYKDLTLFFDDDQAYIVYGAGEIKCAELGEDFTVTAEKPLFTVVTGDDAAGKEAGGTHILKKDGYYYVFHAVTANGSSQQVCHRTQDFLSGNWEEKVILAADFDGYGSVAQGGVIDTADGKWYAFLMQDRGALGSVPVLTDCTWKENWPMLGKNGDGKTVEKTMPMAVVTSSDGKALVKSDEFYNGGKQAETASAKQAELYAAGETGDTGTGETEELVEFVSNGNFEEDTLEGWTKCGWVSTGATKITFSRVEDPKNASNHVLKMTNRDGKEASVCYDVSGDIQEDKTYTLTGKILVTEGEADEVFFDLLFQNGADYTYNDHRPKAIKATKGEWTEFTYEYKLAEGKKFTTGRNVFFLEGGEYTDGEGNKKYMDIYLDDISLKGPAVPVEELEEFVSNGDFEQDSLAGWTKSGWIGALSKPTEMTFARVEDPKNTSNHVLKLTDREGPEATANYDVSGKLQAGKKYTLSGKIYYDQGADTASFNLTFQNGNDYNFNTTFWGAVQGKKGEWTEFTFEYTPEADEKFTTTRNVFFLEGGEYTESGTKKYMDIYLDDISLVGPKLPGGGDEPGGDGPGGDEPGQEEDEEDPAFVYQLFGNGDAEKGSAVKWTTTPGEQACKLEATEAEKANGKYSIHVSDRKSLGAGPCQDISGKLEQGKKYTVSGKIKYNDGADTRKFNVVIQNGPNYNYREALCTVEAKKGEWTKFSATYEVHDKSEEFKFDPEKNFVFIETPPGSNDLADFYLDDFSMTTPPENLIANGSFEDGTVDPWTKFGGVTLSPATEGREDEKSLSVSERAEGWCGPQTEITDKLIPGMTYRTTAYVKYTEDTETSQSIGINARLEKDGKAEYATMASGTIKKGQWTKVTGTWTVPEDMDGKSVFMYVQPEKPTLSYLIDDVSLYAKVGGVELPQPGENDDKGSKLNPVWQWNHNPNNNNWSLTERSGWLRLNAKGKATGILDARNTLTQRTFGPACSGKVKMDISNMRLGDVAGLAAFSYNYGYVAVKKEEDGAKLVMVDASGNSAAGKDAPVEKAKIACEGNDVYLKEEFNFAGNADGSGKNTVNFYYSFDGSTWTQLGQAMNLVSDESYSMGSRFAIFNYTTLVSGGYVDFDYFRVSDKLTGAQQAPAATLNASMAASATEISGVINSECEVKLMLDALAAGNHSSLKASIHVPDIMRVEDVEFNTAAIKGEASYAFKNGRLTINVKGSDVSFSAADKLFATIKLKLKNYADKDQAVSLSTDYVRVDGEEIEYNVSQAKASVNLKYLDTKALAKKLGYGNPIMTQEFGADPYAIEYNGRIYVYMTADDYQYATEDTVIDGKEYKKGDVIPNNFSYITSLRVVSSADLMNWTDHGEIQVAGKNGGTGPAEWASHAWAPAIAYNKVDDKDKFFLYFANDASGIGVLEADTPLGPWKDPIGKALITGQTPGCEGVVWCFDPAVLVDDDGSAYIYFGGGVPNDSNPTSEQINNPKTARVAKLGADMVSIDGEAKLIDAPCMFEDGGIFKFDGKYYYSYCSNFIEGHTEGNPGYGSICYMMSDDPMGPFEYQGEIFSNPSVWFNVGGNNHHATFVFENKSYFIYHAQTVSKALGVEKGYRSTHIDDIKLRANGTIQDIKGTYQGISQLHNMDPYQRIEAETIAWNAGVKAKECAQPGALYNNYNMALTDLQDGDWTSVSQLDFGVKGSMKFQVSAASAEGGSIEVRVDSPVGELIGTAEVAATGGEDTYRTVECAVENVTGVHNIFLVFRGSETKNIMNVDYFQFTEDPNGPVVRYTVTLDANEGEVSPATIKVRNGSKIGTLPTPTRTGFSFEGWFTEKTGGTVVTADTVVNGDMTIYAHWKEVQQPPEIERPTDQQITDMNSKIDEAKKLLADLEGAEKGKLQAAITAAEEILKKEGLTKTELAEALDALTKAVKDAKDVIESSKPVQEQLKNRVEEAKKLLDKLSDAQKAKLQPIIDEAEAILKKTDATEKEIQDVLDKLKAAIENAEEIVAAEKKLNDEIADAEKLLASLSDAEKEKLQAAIDEAKAALKAENVTKEQLERALNKLKDAVKDAVESTKPVDEQLNNKIAEAEKLLDKLTGEDREKLQAAIDAAKEVLKKEGVTEDEIREALDKLKVAVDEAEEILKPVSEKLIEKIDEAKKLLESLSDDKKKELQAVIDEVEAILSKEGVTEDEIKEALAKLEAAIEEAQKPVVNPPAQNPKVGETFKTSNGLKYKITAYSSKKKTVTVTGMAKKPKSLTIPATVSYKKKTFKVTAIGKSALTKQANLKSVVIGKNVTSIGTKAFYNDKKLTKVTFKGTAVKTIGKNAFKGINKKASFVMKKTFTVKNVKYKITKSTVSSKLVTVTGTSKKKLATLVVPATVKFNGMTFNVTAIDKKAFKNKKQLKNVTVGKNVKSIGAEAFSGDSKLAKIKFSGTALKSIGKNAFKGIKKNATFTVKKSKKAYYKNLLKRANTKKFKVK